LTKRWRPWRERGRNRGRIFHIEHDWITPADYLPYIDALLGDIDLDPCTTYKANQEFIRAKNVYTFQDDGLNQETPWFGKTYLFPPTYGRCSYKKGPGKWVWSPRGGPGSGTPSVIWFRRLVKEWKLRNIPEALFFCINPEVMRLCPEIWDFPVCIPTDRARLIHGNGFWCHKTPVFWGYFAYLPRLEYGFHQADAFIDIFSNIGKVIY